jgi:IS5 family transposase
MGVKMAGQAGFFDLDDRYAALSAAGDPLEKLAAVVNFEVFRYRLEKARKRSDRSKGGRPPYDSVLMFKILVLQALYGLSDDQVEFQIRDRLSFMRFLGLGMDDTVPDAKTVWLFRELLTVAGALDKLFAVFEARLEASGYLAMSGQIVDASIIAAPKQRNTDDEKRAIKEGRIPEGWKDKPAKLRQKDRDARWTLKRGRAKPQPDGRKGVEIAVPEYGYKNHISMDRRHGLIRTWTVTDAAAYDGKQLRHLLDKENLASPVWADTAYRSKSNESFMERNGFQSKVHFKKPSGKSLPQPKAKANAARSRVRSKIEHVFGAQKARMGLFIRTIGIARARTKIGMANLVYNMRRLVWLEGKTAPA